MAEYLKTALVLPGGGTSGVIQGGACLAFEEMGLRFDLTVCSSVGSCTGPYSNTGQMRQAIELWTHKIHGRQFIRLTRRGVRMDIPYLLRTLHKIGKLNREALGRDGEIVCVFTDMDTGEAVYAPLTPQSDPWRFIRGSIGIPGLVKPLKILGRPHCGDGGISDPLPIEYAISRGCTDITVVLTHPAAVRMAPLLARAAGAIFLRDFPNARVALEGAAWQYNHSLKLIKNPPMGVRIRVVEPPWWPWVHFLCTDREKLLARCRHGYREAYRIFGRTSPQPPHF